MIIIISVLDVSKTENIIPLGTRTSGVAGAAERAIFVVVIPQADNPFVEDRQFSFLLPSPHSLSWASGIHSWQPGSKSGGARTCGYRICRIGDLSRALWSARGTERNTLQQRMCGIICYTRARFDSWTPANTDDRWWIRIKMNRNLDGEKLKQNSTRRQTLRSRASVEDCIRMYRTLQCNLCFSVSKLPRTSTTVTHRSVNDKIKIS
jgi:hypothetical protein